MLVGSSSPARVRVPTLVNAQERTGMVARKSSRSRLEPVLRFDQLARSEQVDYGLTGRNVFAPAPVQVPVEAPIAPARPSDAELALAAPTPPKAPSMDLKYLGYAQGKDKVFNALFVHGSDMFVAKSGDIMFHRFKVGTIQASGVQVTDLNYNNTQTISITAN